MECSDIVVLKRWQPIMEDYERIIQKKSGRKFNFEIVQEILQTAIIMMNGAS
jgi:hypothetical protein